MLSNQIKESVTKLSSFDKALLIQYLYDSMSENEDSEILNEWITESEKRLNAVKEKKLETIDYTEIKKKVI